MRGMDNNSYEMVIAEIAKLRDDFITFTKELPSKVKVRVINGSEKELTLEEVLKDIWEATRDKRDYLLVKNVLNRHKKLTFVVKVLLQKIIPITALIIVLLHFFRFQLAEVIKFIMKVL